MTSKQIQNDQSAQPLERVDSDRIKVQNRTVLSDKWARLEQVSFDYLRSEGDWQPQTREIYHRGHGAAILLYNLQHGSIILTRQFRLPAWAMGGEGFLLEVPAGIIEAENPVATIVAETEQETGFLIGEPDFLFKAFASPGSVTEQLFYYAAPYDKQQRSGTGGGLAEEGEDIEVLEVALDQAVQWVKEGIIMDAKTIILIQYAQINVFGITTVT